MKFVFVSQYFPPEIGAAHTRLDAMIRELRELGHEAEVVTAMPNYPLGRIFPEYRGSFYRREVREDVVVHRVWVYAALGGGLRRMLNYFSFAVTSLFGLLRVKNKPDYLFVESPPLLLSLPAYLYSRLRGIPFIFNVSDLWPDTVVEMGILKEGPALKFLRWLERWSYRKAAYVNAMTAVMHDTLLHKKGVPTEKLLFLPNGVDTRRFKPQPPDEALKQSLGLSNKKIVLFAGTLGSAHALDKVLEAAKLLEKETDIHFLFVGDGSERANLQTIKNNLSLSNVDFHDPVPLNELASYYSIAECGLASLRNIPIFEGARPSKIFPVLASGKPVIFFGGGEGARLVETAEAGVTVEPENAEALAKTILQLFQDPARLAQLGVNGRKFVEGHHQWSKLVSCWIVRLQQQRSIHSSPNLSPANTPNNIQV